MRNLTIILVALIVLCVIVIGAVSFHSLEEIHYLKSFYPGSFTAEEAFYAALVEFIKIHIISLPLMVIILLAAFFLWLYCAR